VIREHQDRWIDAYDEWHAQLSRAAMTRSPWWWLMPVSRPNLWAQQDLLKPLFFAAAACEWWETHHTDLPRLLVGCPPEVRWYLEEFGQVHEPGLQEAPPTRVGWPGFAKALARAGGGFIQCLRYAMRRAPTSTARILFYSHIVGTEALQETGDHFFGEMLDVAESAIPGAVLTGYGLRDDHDRITASRILAESRRHFTFILDDLTLLDACWIAVVSLRACQSLGRLGELALPIRLGRWVSRHFAHRYAAAYISACPPVLELAVYRAFRRLLRRTGVRTVVYPYEEKALERALLKVCAEASPPVKTLGYVHAANTTCHLALRMRPEGFPHPPQPSLLLSPGPQVRDFLVRWGRKRAGEVATIGSHRYLEPLGGGRTMGARQRTLHILIVIGHGYEVSLLANFLERRRDLFADDTVWLRRYEFAWQAAQDRGLERLLRASPRVQIAMGSLRKQLAWCDVALFSSTSVGIQAMLAGRLAIYVHLHDVWEADPLLGSPACFARCATAEELAEALARARALTDAEYADQRRTQRAFATTIFQPLDRTRFVASLRQSAPGLTEVDRGMLEPSQELLAMANRS